MAKADKTNIYFFYGPDTFRALNTLRQWRTLFENKHGAGSVRELASSDTPYRLSELAENYSLFNKVTLTVIRDPFGVYGEALVVH